jgi:triosephosphate isomerase
MSKIKKPKLIIANWKMNPQTVKEAKKTFADFKKEYRKSKNTGIVTVFCPAFHQIETLKKSYNGQKIFFGAQDVFYEKKGSYTGEISTNMIKDLGARFVIVGHSERRAMGEANELISKKVLTSLKSGLHTILCIGEEKRDAEANYLKEIIKQIKETLDNVPANLLKNLMIAYEPIWAIGEGKKAMDHEEMHFISLFIKKQLIKIYNKKVANQVSILYGGSINSDNAADFTNTEGVDGLLVGRASLNPFEFAKIIKNVSS